MTNFQTYRPSLDDILDGTPLTPAEEELLAACKTIGAVSFGEEVPEEATPENSIRGELIRYLMMGGCEIHRPNAQGIFISGSFITGSLNLDGCGSPLDLYLVHSRFEQRPNFSCSELGTLVLIGSHLPGLIGDRMSVKRDLIFSNGFVSTATVILNDVRIGGMLSCIDGQFVPENGLAIKAHRLDVSGNVMLRNGFYATGGVELTGARVRGQLSCVSGKFFSQSGPSLKAQRLRVSGDVFLREGFQSDGVVDLMGARISGQLDCTGGQFSKGLRLQSSEISDGLLFRQIKGAVETIDLSAAHCTRLVDDQESWSNVEAFGLNGFRFDEVHSEMSVAERLHVLKKHAGQNNDAVFHSQPYTHLAGYYQKIGQRQAAAQVLYEREARQAKAEWARAHKKLDGTWREAFRCQGADFVQMFRWIFQFVAGFGHQPMRAFYWALATVAVSMLYFHLTWINGQMVPNSDIILNSPAWLNVVKDGVPNPAEAWGLTAPGRDYETFSAIGYGFDLFVPLDALGQEIAWAPSYSRGGWGAFGHYLRWPIQIMGWVLTAIGAALLTGLIGRDRE